MAGGESRPALQAGASLAGAGREEGTQPYAAHLGCTKHRVLSLCGVQCLAQSFDHAL